MKNLPIDNSTTCQRAAAEAIADFLSCIIVAEKPETRTGYSHMGATLTDTVLQAGLNYRSVVLPRVTRMLAVYPNAKTTTSFWSLFLEIGPVELFQWSHPEKIERLIRLVALLRTKTLETESDLALWLSLPDSANELLAIKGIGPKTVDYLKILVGIPTVAVDRHVRSLFRLLGLKFVDYDECKAIVCQASELLRMEPHVVDGLIWQFVSTSNQFGS